MPARERLPRSFFQRDPCAVARALLGQRLVRRSGGRRVSGIIVETEAYLGIADKAAHTYGGRRTRRNAAMWGEGGHAYVYFIYGMHYCVNVVAGGAGEPVAVLIRALEPDEGLETMRQRRPRARRDTDLCSGPAKLCQALGITRGHDGADLVAGSTLFLERLRARTLPLRKIGNGPRIGVAYAEEWQHRPLRYWIVGNPHVSADSRR
ncbi:MAG TPA: DNA-3-methyladenine glycosylase [Acidobacteriota bacterium]